MSNEEQHRMLCEIMAKLVPILTCDELSLLSHHLGIKISEFYGEEDETCTEAV